MGGNSPWNKRRWRAVMFRGGALKNANLSRTTGPMQARCRFYRNGLQIDRSRGPREQPAGAEHPARRRLSSEDDTALLVLQ